MRLVTLLGIMLGGLLLAAILFPVFATTGRPYRSPCLSNVKQLSVGMIIYGDDNDAFPPRDQWVDATYPYTKSWELYRCPLVAKGSWGYAFNGALDSKSPKKVKAAETVPMIYDSVNLLKNASDLVKSLPAKPRHTRNIIGYADGHARAEIDPKR